MDRSKISVILTMLAVLLVVTAVSGCTTGSMTVSPTPAPTVAPTAQPVINPTVAPTAAPTTAPGATTIPAPSAVPAFIKGWGPYPTSGPWMPGDDTFVPTPTPYAAYLLSSPWIDQKIQVVGPIVLNVTGNVETPLYLKMIDIKGFPQKTVTATVPRKSGTLTLTATGALLNSILDAASPGKGATSVKFTAADGSFSSTVKLSDIRGSPDSIIGIMSDGSLRDILVGNPPFTANNWVSGLGTIQVI